MNFWPASTPPLMPKPRIAPAPLGRYFLARCVVGMAVQAGIGDPADAWGGSPGTRPPPGRCCDVALHAQAERLDALQGLPAVERRLAGADVAQDLHARLDDEGRQPGAEQVGVDQAVVGGVGRGEVGEAAAASSRSCRRRR